MTAAFVSWYSFPATALECFLNPIHTNVFSFEKRRPSVHTNTLEYIYRIHRKRIESEARIETHTAYRISVDSRTQRFQNDDVNRVAFILDLALYMIFAYVVWKTEFP